jgi:hypothetical protein
LINRSNEETILVLCSIIGSHSQTSARTPSLSDHLRIILRNHPSHSVTQQPTELAAVC